MSILATAGGIFLLWRYDAVNRVRLALPRPEATAMFDATENGLASLSSAFTDGLHDGSLSRYLAIFVATTLVVGGAAFLGGEHLPGTPPLQPQWAQRRVRK